MKRFSLIAALAVILTGQHLNAHEKTPELRGAAISGRLSVPVYSPIVIEAEIEVPDGWDALYDWDAERPLRIIETNDGKTAHVWGPPGEYEVELEVFLAHYDDAVKRVKFQKKTLTTLLTITGEAVKPDKPLPDGPKRAAIIFETAAGVPITAEMARKRIEDEAGAEVFISDVDAVTGGGGRPGFLEASIKAAREVGLPALVVSVDGVVTRAIKLPAKVDDIVGAVQ